MKSNALRASVFAVSAVFVCAAPSLAMMPVQIKANLLEEQSIFEGDWESPIGASKILFRFERENNRWVGWFVSRKNGQSYPLKDVRVKGRTLSFTHTSKPELRYEVTAQKDNQTLSGIMSQPDGDATPRSLVRVQGQ